LKASLFIVQYAQYYFKMQNDSTFSALYVGHYQQLHTPFVKMLAGQLIKIRSTSNWVRFFLEASAASSEVALKGLL